MGFTIEPRGYDDPDVVRMVTAVQQEYVVLYGAPDVAVVDIADFALPTGLLLVGYLDGVAVAMGGWRQLPDELGDGVAEIKRMYTAPEARRRGLARLLLTEVEATARANGLRRLVLNTGPEQPAAIAMYLADGYTAVPGFGHYACLDGALFYGKDL